MKHPERVEDYLEHIAEAIGRATGYLQPVPAPPPFNRICRFRRRLSET
jgi:hypothetical protein